MINVDFKKNELIIVISDKNPLDRANQIKSAILQILQIVDFSLTKLDYSPNINVLAEFLQELELDFGYLEPILRKNELLKELSHNSGRHLRPSGVVPSDTILEPVEAFPA